MGGDPQVCYGKDNSVSLATPMPMDVAVELVPLMYLNNNLQPGLFPQIATSNKGGVQWIEGVKAPVPAIESVPADKTNGTGTPTPNRPVTSGVRLVPEALGPDQVNAID